MALEKTIPIDGKEITFRASAAIPRMYRIRFGRDIFKDLQELQQAVDEGDADNSNIGMLNLEIFENIAYIMALHAEPDGIPDSPDEWLEQFNTFSIYQVLPELIELWGLNTESESTLKKK